MGPPPGKATPTTLGDTEACLQTPCHAEYSFIPLFSLRSTDPMSQPNQNASSSRSRPRTSVVVWIIVVTCAMLLVAGYLFFPMGTVHGVEFNPSTVEQRTFSYWQIPFTKIGITPIVRSTSRPAWAQYLVREGYWKVGAANRWDLVGYYEGRAIERREADAAILFDLLDTLDTNDDLAGKTWSEAHTETAKVLWPRVAKLSHYQLYPYTVILMENARRYPNVKSFEQHAQAELRPLLRNDLQQAQAAGNRDRARRIAQFALTLWPNGEPWKSVAAHGESTQ